MSLTKKPSMPGSDMWLIVPMAAFLVGCFQKQDHKLTAPPTPVYTVSGHVSDSFTNQPIAGQPVALLGAGADTTDGEGFYSIYPVEGNRNYVLAVERPGYAPFTKNVTVGYGDRDIPTRLGRLIRQTASIESDMCLDYDGALALFRAPDEISPQANEALVTARYQPTGVCQVMGGLWIVGRRFTYRGRLVRDAVVNDVLQDDGVFLGRLASFDSPLHLSWEKIVLREFESTRGLAWDGSDFWLSSFSKIVKIDTLGHVLGAWDTPDHPIFPGSLLTVSDPVWSSGDLFGVTLDALMQFNADLSLAGSWYLPGEPLRGVTFVDDALWTVSSEGHFNLHKPDDTRAVQGYYQALEDLSTVRGLAWDGRHLWATLDEKGVVRYRLP